MICNNWACFTKINTIPWFNTFSQQIFAPFVKSSGWVAQIFCLILLRGEILFASNLVQCVGSICTLRLALRMRQGTRDKMTKIYMCFFIPDTGSCHLWLYHSTPCTLLVWYFHRGTFFSAQGWPSPCRQNLSRQGGPEQAPDFFLQKALKPVSTLN